jgi:hypothetical protein
MLDMGLTTTRQATMHRTGRTIHPLHTGEASQSRFLDSPPSATFLLTILRAARVPSSCLVGCLLQLRRTVAYSLRQRRIPHLSLIPSHQPLLTSI